MAACPRCRRPRNFFPALVRPRSSRCLCTGSTIQFMRGSCPAAQHLQLRAALRDAQTEHVAQTGTSTCAKGAATGIGCTIGVPLQAASHHEAHLSDGRVCDVDQDDLKVLVRGVLHAPTAQSIHMLQTKPSTYVLWQLSSRSTGHCTGIGRLQSGTGPRRCIGLPALQ